MAGKTLDVDRAARLLVEADFIGNDKEASRRLGIADRTLRTYRKRALTDPVLKGRIEYFAGLKAATLKVQRAQADLRWRTQNQKALMVVLQRIEELAPEQTDIVKLVRVAEVLSGSEQVGDALNAGSSAGTDRPGRTPEADPGSGAQDQPDPTELQ
jgi:hypothetical protein